VGCARWAGWSDVGFSMGTTRHGVRGRLDHVAHDGEKSRRHRGRDAQLAVSRHAPSWGSGRADGLHWFSPG
jgi:hypothetical protein